MLVSVLLINFVVIIYCGLSCLNVVVVRIVFVGMWMKVWMLFYMELKFGILLVRNFVMVSMLVRLIIYYDFSICSLGGKCS